MEWCTCTIPIQQKHSVQEVLKLVIFFSFGQTSNLDVITKLLSCAQVFIQMKKKPKKKKILYKHFLYPIFLTIYQQPGSSNV